MVRRKPRARSISSQHTPNERSRANVLINKNRTGIRHMLALKEIKHFRRTVHMLIPKLPFSRIVREILLQLSGQRDMRISATALEALQEALEAYLVQFFEDCILVSMHAKRVTLRVQDVRLLRRLRGRTDVAN